MAHGHGNDNGYDNGYDLTRGCIDLPMFTRLNVWKAAHELSLGVYRVTAGFPKYEIYGLSAQIRGAAASVGANIAEGQRRGSARQFIAFLRVSQGSLA